MAKEGGVEMATEGGFAMGTEGEFSMSSPLTSTESNNSNYFQRTESRVRQ